MRFSLLALSTLFAVSLAAPAPQSGYLSGPETGDLTDDLTDDYEVVPEIEAGILKRETQDVAFTRRTDDNPIIAQLTGCIDDVKVHTAKINKTISGQMSFGAKGEIIGSVKGEMVIIVNLVSSIIGEVSKILGGSLAITGELKGQIVGLVFGLIVEILFTLKACLSVLQISVFELLGSVCFLLLSVVLHLITMLDVKIDGVLSLVFGLLGGVSGVFKFVLGGLLGQITGILGGGVFGGLLGGLLSCLPF